VSSIKDRQRAAARARLEKEMAERSAAAHKRRQRQTILGAAIALVVVAAGTVWLVSTLGKDGDKTSNKAAAPGPGSTACVWNPDASGGQNPSIKDVGTPPTTVPNVGNEVMTIDTSLGAIKATLDLTKVPCTAASFSFLSGKKFFDNTKCHRLVTAGIKVLQCGDPSATGAGYRKTDGQGGPSYRYAEENLPTNQKPTYPAGVIAMAKTQEAASTGSQFFVVYGDSDLPADYTVLGKITAGMDIVESVAKAGVDDANGKGDGHPKKEIVIKTLTVAKA
jgi:peptidyl-prolyl cis-trans isomerase B (cyclophilin B)